MKTYKISLRFTNPYIGNRNGGDKTLETGLVLKEAQSRLLDLYNEKFDCDRSFAPNWGIAVVQSQKFLDGASPTFPDGTRQFSWDSRVFEIEEEIND